MLLLSRSVFLMAPRTGSTWARQALRNAGVRYKEWGPKHSLAFPSGAGAPHAPAFRFTFAREPAAWARSRWTLGPWEDSLKKLWCPDPGEFCSRLTPAMVEMYFASFANLCQFVGRSESLADDLVRALEQAGEAFNERDLRATPRLNESSGRLDLGAFYDLMPGQWCGLPAEDLLRMPTDLLPQLPDAAWERLSPAQHRELSKRLLREALPARPRDLPVRV